jgi:NTE family protein
MNHELIISSGGVKGYILLGVLHEMDVYHPLDKFTYYTGTSMGSLLSALLAFGCTFDEMKAILVEIEWFDFLDVKIRHFLDEMGFIETFHLQKFMKAILSYKQISPTITFQELYQMNGKILTVGVTNVTKRKGEFHSYLTTPHMSVIQSLMMSISIPILFKPISYQGCLYSDGGIANHFPYYYHKDTYKMGICLMERDLFQETSEILTPENELLSYLMNIMGTFSAKGLQFILKVLLWR